MIRYDSLWSGYNPDMIRLWSGYDPVNPRRRYEGALDVFRTFRHHVAVWKIHLPRFLIGEMSLRLGYKLAPRPKHTFLSGSDRESALASAATTAAATAVTHFTEHDSLDKSFRKKKPEMHHVSETTKSFWSVWKLHLMRNEDPVRRGALTGVRFLSEKEQRKPKMRPSGQMRHFKNV